MLGERSQFVIEPKCLIATVHMVSPFVNEFADSPLKSNTFSGKVGSYESKDAVTLVNECTP